MRLHGSSLTSYFNISEVKQRSERSAISSFNSSELKQSSEERVISQFNRSGLKKRSERSHKNCFSMTCVRTAL